MYLFVYKTIHKNGKFYIGRHETDNINDNYLGSGTWVKSIKNKKLLSREILEFSNNIEELKLLEEYYIEFNWNNPNCMNYRISSEGFTSEESKKLCKSRVINGTHPFMTRSDGTNLTQDRVANGTHPFMTRPDKTNLAQDRVANGTHNWQGPEHNKKMLEAGVHPFMKRKDGSSLSSDRVKNGTHHFLTRSDGTSITQDTVKNGTHNWVKQKGTVACYDRGGNYIRLDKEKYNSQQGIMNNWEFVTITSHEGIRRKQLRR